MIHADVYKDEEFFLEGYFSIIPRKDEFMVIKNKPFKVIDIIHEYVDSWRRSDEASFRILINIKEMVK